MIEGYREYYFKKEEKKIISGVLSKFPLLGATISALKFVEDRGVKTAKTDGDTVTYSGDFLESLSYEEKIFLFAHEIMHVALKHLWRIKDRDSKIWNRATDAVINARLCAEGLPLIEGGVDMPSALDKSSEEVYEELKKLQDKKQSQGGSGDKGCTGDCHADHSEWSNSQNQESGGGENPNENNSSAGNKEDSDGKDDKNSDTNNESLSEEEIEELEKHFGEMNKEMKEKMASEIVKRMKTQAGKSKAEANKTSMGDIGNEKALVKWKRLLRRELDNEEYAWTYRRSDEDNYFQARLETIDVYDHPITEVMLDTSGSISDKLLRSFLRQLKPLLRESKLFVGCFDTEFYGFTEIKKDKDINSFVIKGRGGTSFDEAVKHFSKDNEINKIIFTDGEDELSNTEENRKLKNVIWLVFENKDFKPCCGKVIFVSPAELKFLEELSIENDGM